MPLTDQPSDRPDAPDASTVEAIHAFADPGEIDLDSTVPFDVRRYTRHPVELRRSDVDVTALSVPPLAKATRRALSHLVGLERHTVRHLRDVLVTPSHKESRVTAFLTTWAYEQYWLADTLGAVLAANGGERTNRRGFLPTARQRRDDRWLPVYNAVTTNLIGADFVAHHMVTGLLNTLVSRFAYHRLAELDPRPELIRVVERIQAMKEPHVTFYEAQAGERLRRSARAQQLTRFTLRRSWSWPGSRYEDRSTTSFVVRHLLGDPRCRAEVDRIDARISRLPGLSGVAPLRREVARYGLGRRSLPFLTRVALGTAR